MQTRLKLLDAWRGGEGFGDVVFDGNLFERMKFEGEIERIEIDKSIRASHY